MAENKRITVLFITLILVLLAIVIFAAYADSPSERAAKREVDKPVIHTTSEPAPEVIEVATFEVGESVIFGDYGITVVEVTASNDDKVRQVDILIEVENKGKEPLNVDSSYFKLIDTNDREFEPSDSISFGGDPIFMYDSINPGLRLTKKVKFDVPTDVTTATLAIRDNMFDFGGAKYTLINLGNFE